MLFQDDHNRPSKLALDMGT